MLLYAAPNPSESRTEMSKPKFELSPGLGKISGLATPNVQGFACVPDRRWGDLEMRPQLRTVTQSEGDVSVNCKPRI